VEEKTGEEDVRGHIRETEEERDNQIRQSDQTPTKNELVQRKKGRLNGSEIRVGLVGEH